MRGYKNIEKCLLPIKSKDKIHNEVCKDAKKLYIKKYEIYNKGWDYYSQGNMLPLTEGGNFGGGNCDSFIRTLNICKEAFYVNNISYVGLITEKLKSGSPIGRFHYASIHYWIKKEWKDQNKEWKDFVRENYLIDMVDESYSPCAFVVGRTNGEQVGIRKSDSFIVVCQTLERTIKLIIQRSYRIENKRKGILEGYDQDLLSEFYLKLGLSKVIINNK